MGGGTWANVGVLGDPKNWYNYNNPSSGSLVLALSFSGGNGDAWSGNSAGEGYVRASNVIRGLSGKTSLLLRMFFGSSVFFSGEGIAFDNVIFKQTQAVTFTALPQKTFGNAPFNLGATASSGLAVTYTSSNLAVATVSGNTVTIVGGGQTTITASQAGNANFVAATEVSQTLTVQKATQTVTFAALPAKTLGDANFTLTATSNSGLPVAFEYRNDK
ncbi:MAG: hypothetical protein ORN54_09280, partial [Cyclobacteriaceae bacterium]|nr:hypothetical protein [Cyclobacteriaceae bacterium]